MALNDPVLSLIGSGYPKFDERGHLTPSFEIQ
nr:MAG TPA: hypothetical protein [Caudoviricetes sp.]